MPKLTAEFSPADCFDVKTARFSVPRGTRENLRPIFLFSSESVSHPTAEQTNPTRQRGPDGGHLLNHKPVSQNDNPCSTLRSPRLRFGLVLRDALPKLDDPPSPTRSRAICPTARGVPLALVIDTVLGQVR